MITTELETRIAEVEATLSAVEQAHAHQVRALQNELAALTAQRCAALLAPSGPLAPQPPKRPIPANVCGEGLHALLPARGG